MVTLIEFDDFKWMVNINDGDEEEELILDYIFALGEDYTNEQIVGKM